MSKGIFLRAVQKQDQDILFHWRNKDHVRHMMHNKDKISYQTHLEWFKNMIKEIDKKYYIFEFNNLPSGLVYFLKLNWKEYSSKWGFYLGIDNLPKVGFPQNIGHGIKCMT